MPSPPPGVRLRLQPGLRRRRRSLPEAALPHRHRSTQAPMPSPGAGAIAPVRHPRGASTRGVSSAVSTVLPQPTLVALRLLPGDAPQRCAQQDQPKCPGRDQTEIEPGERQAAARLDRRRASARLSSRRTAWRAPKRPACHPKYRPWYPYPACPRRSPLRLRASGRRWAACTPAQPRSSAPSRDPLAGSPRRASRCRRNRGRSPVALQKSPWSRNQRSRKEDEQRCFYSTATHAFLPNLASAPPDVAGLVP